MVIINNIENAHNPCLSAEKIRELSIFVGGSLLFFSTLRSHVFVCQWLFAILRDECISEMICYKMILYAII